MEQSLPTPVSGPLHQSPTTRRWQHRLLGGGLVGLLCLFLSGCSALRHSAQAQVVTTREQTIAPVAIAPGTPEILPRDVAHYATYGYSAWQTGPGEDEGQKWDLMPTGYTGAAHATRLLSYFAISDIHITDKESPAEGLEFGWNAPFQSLGILSSAYSPVILSTTQVLDATIRTVNALHKQTPLDFGLCLGDVANSSQYNELRWFIDVMDGKHITPSSGAHLGAATVDYQKPFQAAGLDRSIPWYEVIGNHDQYWMGIGDKTAKVQSAQVGSAVLNMASTPFGPGASEGSGTYVGVVDGTTPYGDVIKAGPTANFPTPPTVVADPDRHTFTTAGYISAFADTTSSPPGHGFTPGGSDSTLACYSFVPKSHLPLKVIVFDDTCKAPGPAAGPYYYGGGWIDAARLTWLTNELQQGQDAGQLMILAVHIPINPQKDLFDTTPQPQFYSGSYRSDAQLIALLHNYPNLILLMAGHRHINVVTPQPSPDPSHPEKGFWEVETSSLRDFPREFRTFDILRNTDNSISIVTTDVDPMVRHGSVAEKSLGYAIGATRVFGNTALTDTSSHAYNAELIKQLTPAMQAKIASYNAPCKEPTK
jgi:metallophosphoesterase (TIGR03768 family)